LGRFRQAEVIWCQEEPENMGAWTFVDRRLEKLMIELGMSPDRPRYVGRSDAAAPATGLMSRHLQEQSALVDESLTLPTKRKPRKTASRRKTKLTS
jgi:2-oxoglutarate dehydrogenase E1 component